MDNQLIRPNKGFRFLSFEAGKSNYENNVGKKVTSQLRVYKACDVVHIRATGNSILRMYKFKALFL